MEIKRVYDIIKLTVPNVNACTNKTNNANKTKF